MILLRMPKSTTNYFLKSFIPSTIKLWNSLAENIRTTTKIESFKDKLNHIYKIKETYFPYLCGKTNGHVYLARIRMSLSGLNSHRKKFHFIEHSTCPDCFFTREDEEHYFLLCANHAAPRMDMVVEL